MRIDRSKSLFNLKFPYVNFDELIMEPEMDDTDPEKEWDYYFDKTTKKMYAYNEFEQYDKYK